MRLPVFRWDDTRPVHTRLRQLFIQARALVDLPPAVRSFYVRALWTAWRKRDQYSFDVVARPRDLAALLRLAADRDRAVELGTATAWTAIALCLARASRRVTTYDPVERTQRQLYLDLVPADVSDRITFVHGPGRMGPTGDQSVEFLFVDGSHDREDTIVTFNVWRPAMTDGGRIVFHDYLDPGNPGVTEAIRELQIPGYRWGRLFVWTSNGRQPILVATRPAISPA
ncbi:MAG TPA: class I SAM-dependent methyltransferase [Solirubrobacteraceae bacterium]|jgi:predicted O-methyltransferase YrrM